MAFSSYINNQINLQNLSIGNEFKIKRKTSCKFLEVIIDQYLRWSLQIQDIVNKLGHYYQNYYLRGF